MQVTVTCAEDRKKFSISFSALSSEYERDADVFKVVDLPIDDLLAKSSDDAALMLGKTILNLFQKLVEGGIGFEDAESNGQLDHLNKLMRDRAEQNDPEAQSYIASNYLSESVEKCDESLLELAEHWFKKSADTGHEDSKSFFQDTWPTVRDAYRKEIRKRQEQE